MAIYQVMYWADIPVQVRAKGSGGRAKAQLPERFQEAIDLAAMAVGWIGSDEYTNAKSKSALALPRKSLMLSWPS
jgi:hypothetical protein